MSDFGLIAICDAHETVVVFVAEFHLAVVADHSLSDLQQFEIVREGGVVHIQRHQVVLNRTNHQGQFIRVEVEMGHLKVELNHAIGLSTLQIVEVQGLLLLVQDTDEWQNRREGEMLTFEADVYGEYLLIQFEVEENEILFHSDGGDDVDGRGLDHFDNSF